MSSDKAYAVEQRHNALVNRLSGMGLATNASTFTGGDTNTWNVGWSPRILTADATACSSTSQTSTGLSMTLGTGTYAWDGDIWMASSTTSGAIYLMGGGATFSDFVTLFIWDQLQSGKVAAGFPADLIREQTTFGTSAGGTAGLSSTDDYYCRVFGYGVCTAGGTLQVNQALTASGGSFQVKKGSVLRVYPQT